MIFISFTGSKFYQYQKNLSDIISRTLEYIKRLTESCRKNDYFHLQGCFVLPFILRISESLACEMTC